MDDVKVLDKIKDITNLATLSESDENAGELLQYLSSGDGFQFLETNGSYFSLENVWIYSFKVDSNGSQTIVINNEEFQVEGSIRVDFPQLAASLVGGPIFVENIHNKKRDSSENYYYGIVHILYKPAL